MPTPTYYVRSRHEEYLDELCDRYGYENPSHAIRAVIDDHMENNE